jgi:hypothetical protein
MDTTALDTATGSNSNRGKGIVGDDISGRGNVRSGGDEVHHFTITIADHVVADDGDAGNPLAAAAAAASTGAARAAGGTRRKLMHLRRLWAGGKDALALRLKAALCQAGGMPAPPALLSLPDDLKLACLEYLSAADLAAVSCTCAELRYIAAADDLWRPLYVAEFGEGGNGSGGGSGGSVSRGDSSSAAAATEVTGHGSARGFQRSYARKLRERRAQRLARQRREDEQRRRAAEFQAPLQPAPTPYPNPLGGFFGG